MRPAGRSPVTLAAAELLNDAVGEVDAAGLYADQHGVFEVDMVFQQLMGQSLDGDGQLLFVQDDLQGEIFIKIR